MREICQFFKNNNKCEHRVCAEHCSNCEEAHRDAYVARMQLARLQAIVTSPRQELQRSISLSDDHVSTEADVPMKMSAERCAHSVADITALMSKLEYFKQAFASLQADNKGTMPSVCVVQI